MKPNFKFFIYAFPAMDGCCGMKKRELNGYLEMILKGVAPSKKELDELFPAAQMRREEKYGKDYWKLKNTQDYWWVEHNRIIDAGESGYEDADLEDRKNCKVKFWEIDKINGEKIVELKNGHEIVRAYNYRNLELKSGGYVTTHKGHVIEEISYEDFERYG